MRGIVRGFSVIAFGVVAVAVCSVADGSGGAALAASPVRATAAGGTVPVIVFLKSQPGAAAGTTDPSGLQTSAIAQAAQAPYLGKLQQLGATDVRTLSLVDAIAARVPATAVGQLAASPGVASVIPDSPIVGPSPNVAGTEQAPAASTSRGTAPPTLPGACSSTPQLTPEGLALTHTDSAVPGVQTAQSLGFTGAGVKVAFLADGIDPDNPNLMRDGSSVISNYADFSGDGTTAPTGGGEAFLDANAIAGQGSQVYNVSGFSAQTPTSGACDIKIAGVAPGASLVALKVFSDSNVSTTSGFLEAINYAVNVEHVNVINESFGADPFPDVASLDAVEEFNDMAVAAGVTVVVAAGDAGPFNTIGSPAADPDVISVGASTDFQFYAQTNYAGADTFGKTGWEDNNISSISSGGYTQDGQTLDLVAPGDLSFSSCTPDVALYSDCVNFLGKASPVQETGGTSEAAPEVAGAAALVIQAYRNEHGGETPSPATVKQILMSTATDLGAPATEQGSGMLNSLKAVELAESMPNCDPMGTTFSLSANQLNYVGNPGAQASWNVSVSNASRSVEQVSVSGRSFSAGTVIKTALVTLSDKKSQHFTDWSGVPSNYSIVQFKVPAGQSVFNTSIAWTVPAGSDTSSNAPVRLILIDPSGAFAADSLPQGVSGYGTAQVLHPAAGTWSAVIFSDEAADAGTDATVLFSASVAHTVGFGTVSPSVLTLQPGTSGIVKVSATVPSGAGDTSGAVVLNAGGDTGAVTVPVTLRGMVQAGPGAGGTFSGALTGGNGRAPGEGQVESYAFDVPASLKAPSDIDVDVDLANDPQNQVSGYLVAPGGQTMGYGSNYLTTGFSSGGVPVEQPEPQLSLYAANPVAGMWTLIIDFTSPVAGNEVSDPFTGRVRFNAIPAPAGGLPDSPSVRLTAGKAASYKISVSNVGTAPEDVFLDPRLDQMATYQLQPQDTISDITLPLSSTADAPEWIVPTTTHSVSVTATSTVPVMFDFGPYPGDPDEASTAGTTVTATIPMTQTATPVTAGLWSAVPSEVGPFGPGGAPAASVTMSASATMQAFDTTASSAPGDFWEFGVQPLAGKASYNLFTIDAGQTKSITLTLLPSGTPGTVVHGILYVDDFADSQQFLSGSELLAIPYAYTIK